MKVFLVFAGLLSCALALNNGLALTPPMGWLTWERFRCITDCKNYPNECISEALIKRTADLMLSEGYLDAGYNYVGIDDCWLEKERDEENRLVPDRERFPNGMKAVADYLHNKGFKFALYQDYGNMTCAGYPGVLGYEEIDVQTYAEWEVDYIKLDGCNIDISKMDTESIEMPARQKSAALPAKGMFRYTLRALFSALTGEKFVPFWSDSILPQNPKEMHDVINRRHFCTVSTGVLEPDYASIAKHCNLWRNWDDIEDSWSSLGTIMTWFADNQDTFAKYAGPGNWNDPDMLIIGNYGLSLDQAKVQMAIWSILAAPLLMSVDLATIRPEFKEILLSREIIAIDQDVLGKQGLRVWNKSRCEIWKRELSDGSYAMAFVNRRDDGTPYVIKASFEAMDIPEQAYEVQDLYKEDKDRIFGPDGEFSTRVNPSGVKYFKFVPKKSNEIIPEKSVSKI